MSAEGVDLDALVVCPGFRWTPRMRALDNDGDGWNVVLCEPSEHGEWLLVSGDSEGVTPGWSRREEFRPDLDDPATCGCFETLNREAWSPVGGGRQVEIEVAVRCRYDERGRPVPMYAVRVLVLCDTWRLEWETPTDEWQSTRGLALAHALLAAPTKGDGR